MIIRKKKRIINDLIHIFSNEHSYRSDNLKPTDIALQQVVHNCINKIISICGSIERPLLVRHHILNYIRAGGLRM